LAPQIMQRQSKRMMGASDPVAIVGVLGQEPIDSVLV